MISYQPLFEYMKKHNITTYQLLRMGLDNRTLHNLKHNKNITMLTAEKVCHMLGCNIEDIVIFTDEQKEDP